MSEFLQRAVDSAQELIKRKSENVMTTPIAVAGLADTVRNAISGMARAKASADALANSSQRLVGNVEQVESLKTQLDDANTALEGAIAAVGGPLESSSSSGSGSAKTQDPTAQADTSTSQGPIPTATAPLSTAVPSSTSDAHSLTGTPEEGIRKSVAEVQAANA